MGDCFPSVKVSVQIHPSKRRCVRVRPFLGGKCVCDLCVCSAKWVRQWTVLRLLCDDYHIVIATSPLPLKEDEPHSLVRQDEKPTRGSLICILTSLQECAKSKRQEKMSDHVDTMMKGGFKQGLCGCLSSPWECALTCVFPFYAIGQY